MRKAIFLIAFLVGAVMAIQSCYYEYPPEKIPYEPEDVSFKTHILPIFTDKCGTSLCHDGTHVPDLRAENAYRELVLGEGGYINVTIPEESKVYQLIADGSMPPSGSLSNLDKDLILVWIAKGVPND